MIAAGRTVNIINKQQLHKEVWLPASKTRVESRISIGRPIHVNNLTLDLPACRCHLLQWNSERENEIQSKGNNYTDGKYVEISHFPVKLWANRGALFANNLNPVRTTKTYGDLAQVQD